MELTNQAMELRKAGATLQAIADTLKLKSRQHVHKLISDALDDLEATAAQSAKQLRRMQEERLDAMQLKLWPQRGNPRVADTLLRIEQRRAALRGLDAPTLVAPTMPDGSAMPPALDLSKLSTDQLETLEAIYQTCAIDPATDAEPTPQA
jgi:hypothetical protein